MTETGVDPAAHWVGPATRPDTYVLKETIGRGSEGEVWRAELPLSTEGRATVAVKTMFRPPSDEAWEKQSRLLTTLSHPGLVRVTSMFIGPSWHLAGAASPNTRVGYVVMDFVEGMTLREWWDENPDARVSERIRKLRTVAAALDHMHSGGQTVQGVAHGDVKPSNIVVRGDGVAVLVDLGLARLTDGTGIAGRTAPYAAPELRVVDPIPTPEADRFAFVVTMAEVLLGHLVPRVEGLGWVDVAALEEALNRSPRTATRPALVKHILDALAADPPAERCRPTAVGLTAAGGTGPAARSDWLSAWLDSATETLSHVTSTAGGLATPLPPPALATGASADATALSSPRGVPAGGWTAPARTGTGPDVPASALTAAANQPPSHPGATPPPGGGPVPSPSRKRWPFAAAAAVIVVILAIVVPRLLSGGSPGPSTPVAQESNSAFPGTTGPATTDQATTGPATTASPTTGPGTTEPAPPGTTSPATPSNAPQAAGTTNLSSIKPVGTVAVVVSTGPEQIGTTTYPFSVRLTCSGSYNPSVTYNVAGYAFLDAVIGVPNDATNAAGNTTALTFVKDGSTQLGSPINIALGQPQRVHLDLQSAQQLVVKCSPTVNATHQVTNMDIAMGNATIGPGTSVAGGTKSP
ncbi:protein kinase [Frankia sp. Cj3]|uniref:serine/threonine protein kinase n=1 Tax=Frankia sp. Cj3 TaxID=2880976 RepID=UPI001EF58177|nr:protein kinase [Frankia sp. Cj3]